MSSKAAFQNRVVQWVRLAFNSHPRDCKAERAHRFLEEALEAVQAAGTTEAEARELVTYVFSRPVGEIAQEVGGVMITLAPFAAAHEVDMQAAGETELARVNTPEIIAKVRAKNASKPKRLTTARPSMKPSPIEARALARVKQLPEMQALMISQLEKGHADYGGPIDECGYSRPRLLKETGREGADFVVEELGDE